MMLESFVLYYLNALEHERKFNAFILHDDIFQHLVAFYNSRENAERKYTGESCYLTGVMNIQYYQSLIDCVKV